MPSLTSKTDLLAKNYEAMPNANVYSNQPWVIGNTTGPKTR